LQTPEGLTRVVLAEVVREGVTQRIVEKEVHALGAMHGHKHILGYVGYEDIALLSLIVSWLLCVIGLLVTCFAASLTWLCWAHWRWAICETIYDRHVLLCDRLIC
jgi:hypothetical protein